MPRVSDVVGPELAGVEAPTQAAGGRQLALLCPAVTVEAEGGGLSLEPPVTWIR